MGIVVGPSRFIILWTVILLAVNVFVEVAATLRQSTCSAKCKTTIIIFNNNKNNHQLKLDCSNLNISSDCLSQVLSKSNTSLVVDLNLHGNNLSRFISDETLIDTGGAAGAADLLFPNLKYLNLSLNKFTEIPQNLSKIAPKLLELDLDRNMMKSISPVYTIFNQSTIWPGIPSLFLLRLSWNEIERFDGRPFKKGFEGLRRLYLDHNAIEVTDGWTFRGLTKLIILDLQSNKIKSLGVGIYNFSKDLAFLYFQDNFIEQVYSVTFVGNHGRMSLARNNISTIHDMAFSSGLYNKLDLSYNSLASFESKVMLNVNVEELKLDGNPMVCSCPMRKIIRKLNCQVSGNCRYLDSSTGRDINSTITHALKDIYCDPCKDFRCERIYLKCQANSTSRTAKCVCKNGRSTGQGCGQKTRCGEYCKNGAQCEHTTGTGYGYMCICTKEYTGSFCTVKVTTTLPPTKTTKPTAKMDADDGKLGIGTVIGISILAFLVGTLGSLFAYHKIVRRVRSSGQTYNDLKVNNSSFGETGMDNFTAEM